MSDNCNFYVGQRVTMKNEWSSARGGVSFYNGVPITLPVFGVVYTIRSIDFDNVARAIGIRLVELVNPPAVWLDGFKENQWWHGYFRPVTDISDLEKLLKIEYSPLNVFKSLPIKEQEPV